MAKFVNAGKVNDLAPGEMKVIEDGATRILLANVGGKLLAVSDLCPHADAPLCDGMLEGEEVECPWHGSRFNLKSGEVTQSPAEEGIATYEVKLDGEDVLIGPI